MKDLERYTSAALTFLLFGIIPAMVLMDGMATFIRGAGPILSMIQLFLCIALGLFLGLRAAGECLRQSRPGKES